MKKSMHRKRGGHFELVFFDLVHITEFLVVLGLLDRIRGGVYRLVFLTPSVATWSRVRHSEEQGQMPLPSKTEHLVFLSWIHMPSQRCQPRKKEPFVGSHRPSSLWALEGAHENAAGIWLFCASSPELNVVLSTYYPISHLFSTGSTWAGNSWHFPAISNLMRHRFLGSVRASQHTSRRRA